MASREELRRIREEKVARLRSLGINPYTSTSYETHTLQVAKSSFDDLSASQEKITLVGRVMSKRGQGAISFIDLFDGTDRFQLVLKKDTDVSYAVKDGENIVAIENAFDLFQEIIDLGDFIECTGVMFTTQRGAQSLEIQEWRILTKATMPIPTEHFGIKDDEERYRHRYLDMLVDSDVRDMLQKKSVFWNATRSFLLERGYVEVDTPTLEVTTGGAEARPFKTHHNDFDIDVFLRISVGELWQKRLLTGGLPKTFEIGRVYRNEGSSPEHLQEFTNVEFYTAFMDYKEGMQFTEEMIREVVQKTFGTTEFTTNGQSYDLAQPFDYVDYVPHIEDVTGVNVLSATLEEMQEVAERLGIEYEGANKERLTDTLWKYCRKKITGPAWLINVPKVVSPLSKAIPGNEALTERCQLILAGAEVTNGFSELNDPQDQRERFEEQHTLIKAGDDEAMMPEWEFADMLEFGMPPAFGQGFGERLFAFLCDKPIRETQAFPFMKPKGE